MTTLTQHARVRLAERTMFAEAELLDALRRDKTVLLGVYPQSRAQMRLIYSRFDDGHFVLPIDIVRDRVCTVLSLAMYVQQHRAFEVSDHQLFDAKRKLVEPLCNPHPVTGVAVRVRATGYVLNEAGQVAPISLGHHECPPNIASISEMAANPTFKAELLARVRARGLNPARLDSVYVRQGMREPVLLKGIGPANPWAPTGLYDVPHVGG